MDCNPIIYITCEERVNGGMKWNVNQKSVSQENTLQTLTLFNKEKPLQNTTELKTFNCTRSLQCCKISWESGVTQFHSSGAANPEDINSWECAPRLVLCTKIELWAHGKGAGDGKLPARHRSCTFHPQKAPLTTTRIYFVMLEKLLSIIKKQPWKVMKHNGIFMNYCDPKTFYYVDLNTPARLVGKADTSISSFSFCCYRKHFNVFPTFLPKRPC